MRSNLRTGLNSMCDRRRDAGGFTLLEVLVALTITLIMMTLVVQVFQVTSDGIFHSRANMEMSDQIRNAKHRLIGDLRGTTALTIPPIEHTWGVGYFEYFEGDSVAVSQGGDLGFRPTGTVGTLGTSPIVYSAYGDRDDFLMFTTASFDDPFVGRMLVNGQPKGVRSRYAEVFWYPHVIEDAPNANQRLLTLRRRQWLIAAGNTGGGSTNFDSSIRNNYGAGSNKVRRPPAPDLGNNANFAGTNVGNTLESLSKREFRMRHSANVTSNANFNVNYARRGITMSAYPMAPFDFTSLTLQTVTEEASGGTDRREDNISSAAIRTTREADDVILTNLIGFDVKAWDPGAPVFRVVADPDNPELVGCVEPGDPGYLAAVTRFIGGPTVPQNQPVSFGAYADLNYMGFLVSQPSYTFNISATNFPVNRYAAALGSMATSVTGNYIIPYFAGPGDIASKNSAVRDSTWLWSPATYDTYSRHYEYDGIASITGTTTNPNVVPAWRRINAYTGDLMVDAGMNMLDDNGNGLIDEPMERDAVPPYERPLRGIRVNIRVMEPDSKQVREVTVVHEFIPL
jgi:type II secretory pathway pseudopilin PulG